MLETSRDKISINDSPSFWFDPNPCFAAGALWSLVPAQTAESFRYSLISQQKFGHKRGFLLGLEDGAPEVPRHLVTLRLVMTVAGGRIWRFPTIG